MKILVYGCSQKIFHILNRMGFLDAEIDFTDSDSEKWRNKIYNSEMIIVPPSDIEVRDYDYCLIGSERYEEEIKKSCIQMGFGMKQLILPGYIVGQVSKWKKILYLNEWQQYVEDGNIKILKNWYTKNGNLECVIQFLGLRGYVCEIKAFVLSKKKCKLKIFSCINSEELTQNICDGEVSYCINENNDIVKLIMYESEFEIPWVSFDCKKTALQQYMESEKRFADFTRFYDGMQRFYYHDEDYLALKNFEITGTILDVGANYGQSMYAFYRLTSAPIVSVEVVPELCSMLNVFRKKFDVDNRVEILNSGISDKQEELVWYEPVQKHISGSFNREFVQSRKLGVDYVERKLQCNTLDKLCETIGDISIIKLDVEGLEYQAVLGGMATIKKHFPILLVEDNDERNRIADILKDYYELYFYDPHTNCFQKNKRSGINYWLIPKQPFRKIILDNVEE